MNSYIGLQSSSGQNALVITRFGLADGTERGIIMIANAANGDVPRITGPINVILLVSPTGLKMVDMGVRNERSNTK